MRKPGESTKAKPIMAEHIMAEQCTPCFTAWPGISYNLFVPLACNHHVTSRDILVPGCVSFYSAPSDSPPPHTHTHAIAGGDTPVNLAP